MLYGRGLPWRDVLHHVRQKGVRPPSLNCFYTLSKYSNHITCPSQVSPFRASCFARHQSSIRTFTSNPVRRKDRDPDDIPDPLPIPIPEKVRSEGNGIIPDEQASSTRESQLEVKKESGAGSLPGSGKTIDAKGGIGTSGGGDSGAGSGDSGKKSGRKVSSERALQKPTVPDVYPQVMAIPIAKRPLFPGFYKAVTIRDPRVSAAMQESVRRGQPYVGAFLFKDETADKDVIDSMDDVHDVGVFAQITSTFTGEQNSLTAVLYPHRRIKMSSLIPPQRNAEARISTAAVTDIPKVELDKTKGSKELATENAGDVVASFEEPSASLQPSESPPYEPTSFLHNYPVSLVQVENLVEQPYDRKDPIIKAVTSEIVNVFKDVASLNPLFRDQISTFSVSQSAGNIVEEPGKLADFAAAVSAGEVQELQDVLQTMDVRDRLTKALTVLKKELMNAQLQNKISKDVENKIQKRQREYWLMEQMKGIRRELGIESDGKDKLVENFREKANNLAMPEVVQKVFEEELNKLAHLEPAASEFNVTRNYLDWLTQIPWGQRSAENFGIKNAMTVLDEDHYGLKDVKDRILEFIAVGKLRGTVEGKILCFVGPPGVGKTPLSFSPMTAVGALMLNRQDKHRKVDSQGIKSPILSLQRRRFNGCCRDQRPSKDLCWGLARSNHSGFEEVPDRESTNSYR